MATALATQLAHIRAQSTNPLDLKAQKKAHSQSLLFDPSIAVNQDFDSIYHLCYEGFEELCRLDSRFDRFRRSIFSEQSKQEDRQQMTAAQNEQLDVVIEAFLSLISGKLLLKPALKAVEWLIRRFRAHENNTLCLVLTFLPYHTTAMFPPVLSVLPQTVPSALRFLHPYIQSLANPQRHTIVHAAAHNRPFLIALSSYLLKASRSGFQQPTLTSFWASVTTEATASMLDEARSARRESQRQNQEDIILLLLPILNEGLSLGVPDLKIGCYMVLTILASKANLDNGVLIAMMEAVTIDWTETSHAGLICLSTLAQQREDARLPSKVFDAIITLDNLQDDLMILKKKYKVDSLTLGVILGILNDLKKAQDASKLHLVRNLIETNLMNQAFTLLAIKNILLIHQSSLPDSNSAFDVQGSLTDLILRLADSDTVGNAVHQAVQVSQLYSSPLGKRLQSGIDMDSSNLEHMIEDIVMEDWSEQKATTDFSVLVSCIPTRTAYEISFLSHSDSYVFESLENAFSSISTVDTDLEKFSDLPVLRKSLATSDPLFLSFFMRVWCGNSPAMLRAAAIRAVSRYIENEVLASDVQVLLPYVVYALGDSSPKVRRATTELVLILERSYVEAFKLSKKPSLPVLGQEQIYGQRKMTREISWLSMIDFHRFMTDVIVPGLEECLVDQYYISQLISDNLNGSKRNVGSQGTYRDRKPSQRLAIFCYLCDHAVHTPLYKVKSRLLHMLNQITKVGGTSRTKLLLPVISQVANLSQDEYQRICSRELLDPVHLMDQVVSTVVPADREGVQLLKNSIESQGKNSFPGFRVAALHRIQDMWQHIKSDVQVVFANMLLEQALDDSGLRADHVESSQRLESLQALPLSTTTLQSFIGSLPPVFSMLQDESSASKRRRTGRGHSSETTVDSKFLSFVIKRTTLILELVDNASAERHPDILSGLFQIMSHLQFLHSQSEGAADYLLVLNLESILAIVRKLQDSSGVNIDRSAIRINVLVDCVRTTKSPQVRNAALLLISTLATVTPELVLHSVMPVFTFMGTSILHQDDDFSAYVINQTMGSVVPRLVQSLRDRSNDPFLGVSELLLSFAAAFEHIPVRRRLDLYASLIDKVGADEYLFALLTILIDKYPNDKVTLQFSTELTCRYDGSTCLRMVEKYLNIILDARKAKPTLSAPLLDINKDRDMESVTENLLQLPLIVLSDQDLISKISSYLTKNNKDTTVLRSLCDNILEEIFLLSEDTKSSRRVNLLCMRVLDASLGLLPMPDLFNALQSVLARSGDGIQQQVLRSLEQRLGRGPIHHNATRETCIAFLPRLLQCVEESPNLGSRLVALGCLDKIVENFGKLNIPATIDTAQRMANDEFLGAKEIKLRVAILFCLATMVEVLGDNFVSILPKAFSKAMNNLALSIQEETDDTDLHNAVYTLLNALLLYVPWAITGTSLDQILGLSYVAANAEMGEECRQRRVEVMQLISKQVGANDCFMALERTWKNAVTEGPLAVHEYLDILRLTVEHHPKAVVTKQSRALGDLFLRMFDLRRIQLSRLTEDSYTPKEIQEVEEAVTDSGIALTYKLNDATFKPLFFRMLEWTVSSAQENDDKIKVLRQTTWYTFLLKFFGTLKSIVTSYAGFVIEDSVKILSNTNLKDEDSKILWRQVILTLHKTTEHDQDDFYRSPSHFTPVFKALVPQLAKADEIPLSLELIPAIAELAVATDSASHHKDMNNAILKHMRSESPAVRLAAIECERVLTERLGEEWLALLPEMLPFISEAFEDDEEAVECELQRWVAEIEGVLGESLNPMLQ